MLSTAECGGLGLEAVVLTVTSPDSGLEAAVTSPLEAAVTSPLEAAVTSPLEAAVTSPLEAAVTSPLEAAVAPPLETAVTSPLEAAVTSPDSVRGLELAALIGRTAVATWLGLGLESGLALG